MVEKVEVKTSKRDEDLWMRCFDTMVKVPFQNAIVQGTAVKLTSKQLETILDFTQKIYEAAKTANASDFLAGLAELTLGEDDEDDPF